MPTPSVKLTPEEKAELGGPLSEDIPTALTVEDLIETVRLHCDIDRKSARAAVYAILHYLIKVIKSGEDCVIPGFGRLWLRWQGPYMGKDKFWHKDKEILIQPKARVFFTPNRVMLAELNPHLYEPREPDDN